MKPYLFAFIILLGFGAYAQKYDATWVMGYANTIYKFDSTSIYRVDSFSFDKSLFFLLSGGCMSDKNGNLLYISNGLQIHDRNDNLMEGGDQLALGAFDTLNGYDFRQSPLSLPMPGNDSLYYFFYEAYWDTTLDQGSRLYYGIIDMNANDGFGKVTSLNNVLIDTFISDGGLSACKHANGVDWWLIKPKYHSNGYFKFLVKANGIIEGPFMQNIGLTSNPPDYNTELVFSPAGDKMFYTNGVQKGNLFDFDRCTGLLSNPEYIWETQNSYMFAGIGASFSPNGRFIYLTGDSFKIYQVDTYSSNIDSSKILLSRIDLDSNQFASYYQLGPNGKIYIEGYGSPTPLSIINHPDSFGFACGLDTFAYNNLPAVTLGMPNFPYYRTPTARAYQADAGHDTTICFGDTVMLGVPQVDSVVYQWQSSADFLSSTDIAQPLAVPQQTTNYYLTINDTVPRGYSCNVRTDTITVHVVPLPCVLSVNDIGNDEAAHIKLYPNPASSRVVFQCNTSGVETKITIYDIYGRIIGHADIKDRVQISVDTRQWQDGFYIWRAVQQNNDVGQGKIEIMR